jgi:hypothetical protein
MPIKEKGFHAQMTGSYAQTTLVIQGTVNIGTKR